MKKIILLGFIILIIMGCTQKPTEVTVEDSNEDSIYHIGPDDGLLGNVDLYIIPEAMPGTSILLINGPGNPIGYQIRKDDIIYCQDSYIGRGGYTFQSGTSLPFNTWVNVNLVVYKSTFAGWLWPIGDLWDALYDAIVDATYEIEVMLVFEGSKSTVVVQKGERVIELQKKMLKYLDPEQRLIVKDYLKSEK